MREEAILLVHLLKGQQIHHLLLFNLQGEEGMVLPHTGLAQLDRLALLSVQRIRQQGLFPLILDLLHIMLDREDR